MVFLKIELRRISMNNLKFMLVFCLAFGCAQVLFGLGLFLVSPNF